MILRVEKRVADFHAPIIDCARAAAFPVVMGLPACAVPGVGPRTFLGVFQAAAGRHGQGRGKGANQN
jgi:hypothetical protein